MSQNSDKLCFKDLARMASITAANMGIVFIASIFGINDSDAGLGAMPYILALGFLWVLAFTCRGYYLLRQNRPEQGFSFAKRAIPYAFVVLVLGGLLFVIGLELFRNAA